MEPQTPARVTILGDGQMGLVMADALRHALPNAAIAMWCHRKDAAEALARTRTSPRLPHFRLDDRVFVTSRASDALSETDLVVSAAPAQHTRSVWESLGGLVPPGAGVVSVSKGIEIGTLLRPTQVIGDALGERAPLRRLAALSGPTIAGELARRRPATMVSASEDGAFAALVQRCFTTPWLRVYTSEDLVGVELAGAAKNVIAIAAGMLDALEAGFNAKSALLARGLAEIARLGAAMSATPETFFGVAGVGDLATSCFCPEGRNRSCGEVLGKGVRLDDHLARTDSVVEGVATTKSILALAARSSVEMPICEGVHGVLFEGVAPQRAIAELMTRPAKAERVG